jgi:hypothetical protein
MVEYPVYATEGYDSFIDELILARKAENLEIDQLAMPLHLARGIEEKTNYDIRDILWYADCIGLDINLASSLW